MTLKRLITLGVIPFILILSGTLAHVAAQNNNFELLRIAFIGREESKGAELDRQLYQAAVLAADEINAGDDDDDEGVRTDDGTRYNLEIVYYPADTAAEATDALEEALDDEAVAILVYAPEMAAAIQEAGTQGLAVLTGAPDAPDDANIFRVTAALEARAQAAADYWVNERHFTRIGVFAANTDEALSGAEAFKTAAGEAVIVADIVREADEDDFYADAQTLRDEDAQALFVWALDAQTVNLLEALHEKGWDGEVIFAGLDTAFVQNAGELANNLYGFVNWSDAAYDAASQIFAADYAARWNSAAPEATASYYDAVYMLAAAIEDAGTDAAAIRTSLTNQGNLSGVQGNYTHAEIDALILLQTRPDSTFIEVARYTGAVCQNCPDTWWADTSGEESTALATFRIGLIATLDGASEIMGEQIEQAARLAVREINEAGGILDDNSVRYTLDLVTYSAETGEQAAAAFQQAIEDGVQIVIGPDYNAHVLPNMFRADNEEMLQLVSAISDQVTVNGGSYVYQIRTTDPVLASSAAHYLLDVREMTQFATVAVRTDYGLDSADAFQNIVSASDDGEIVLELEHDIDAENFAGLAEQIANANIEAVAVWSPQPAASALMTELQALNWDGVLMYGYLTPDFVAAMGDLSFEIVAPVNWWANAGDWASQDFATRYTARYGETPMPQSAAYYDAIYLIAQGLDDSGVDNLQAWLGDLEQFIGVQGSYRPAVYTSGELTRQVVILSVQQGNISEIARYDNTVCLIGCGS